MPLTEQFVRNLQRFRLVTFDVTDTLIKLKDPVTQYLQTAAACGVRDINRTNFERCFRQQFKLMSEQHSNFGCHTIGWQNWWRQLVINTFNCADATVPQDKLPAIAEHLLNVFRTSACWSHVDCAADLVQCVRGIGKSVGVISNFDASLPKVLKAMDFDDKFDFVLTSYEAGVMKPDPSIFEIPVKMLNIEPNQALHIGNKFDMDYIGARQSGWSSLLVQSQFEPATSEEARRHSYPSIAQMLYALEFEEINW